jgi:hypothetical protein
LFASCCCWSVLLSACVFILCWKSTGLKPVFPHVPAKTVYCGHVASKWIRKVNKAIQQHRRQIDKNFPCLVAVAFCTQWAGFTRSAVRSVIQLKEAPNQYPYRQCFCTGWRHEN